MAGTCNKHDGHTHTHGPNCGHIAVRHEGHTDYLHDGHMHHIHGDHVDDHRISAGKSNPVECTPQHNCGAHDKNHVHGPDCGHQKVPHGDHVDFLVEGHLHHPHNGHCDNHGKIELAS